MSTRAIAYLKKNKIPYEAVKYDHQEKGAEFAAKATGNPLEITVKTLVVELDRKRYCLALLPGHQELNLKKLASSSGCKRTAMVDINTAERLTGYLVGGISPFGTLQRLETVMESPSPFSIGKRRTDVLRRIRWQCWRRFADTRSA